MRVCDQLEASPATAHHDALCQHSLLGVASLRDAGTGAVVWAAYVNRSTTSAGCSRRFDFVLDCNASMALYDLRISELASGAFAQRHKQAFQQSFLSTFI